MKLKRLLIIPIVAALTVTAVFAGCAGRSKKDVEPVIDYEDSIECLEGQTINLYNYVRAYDEDDGDLTKNIEITVKKPDDKDLNWCSDIKKLAYAGNGDREVSTRYDVCNPFAVADGSFTDIAAIIAEVKKNTSKNMTGDSWTATVDSFNTLSEKFTALMGTVTANAQTVIDADNVKYNEFFDKATELYDDSLASFTHNLLIDTDNGAVVGINNTTTVVVGDDFADVDLQELCARLFGYESVESFTASAQALATKCASPDDSIENGSFHATNGSFIFPIAVKNKMPNKALTFVIVDSNGKVFVWLNDIEAALWATNTDEDYCTYNKIRNDLYCKNILFVTGPDIDDFDFDFDFDFDLGDLASSKSTASPCATLLSAESGTVPVNNGLVTLEEQGTYTVVYKITDSAKHSVWVEAEIVVYERGAVFLDFASTDFDVGSAETGKGGGSTANGKITYNVEKFGEKDWHNKIWLKDRFSVADYCAASQVIFSFKAKASKPTVVLLVAPKDGGWDPTLFWEKFTLNELETEYRIVIEADRVSDFNKLEMQFGGWGNSDDTQIEISGVHFEYMNDSGFNG